jgi:uncharacterized protein (DUF924 family)
MVAYDIRRGARSTGIDAASAVVDFWCASEAHWFSKDEVFDQTFHDRFIDLHLEVTARRHDDWIAGATSALALVLLTDQFPRNAFRGTPRMHATDGLARDFAYEAILRTHMDLLERRLQLFFCLPFAHSEDQADQELSVALNRKLGQPWLSHAEGHCDIIRRFGRFPHRNAVLGRPSTPAELRYLAEGGFAG